MIRKVNETFHGEFQQKMFNLAMVRLTLRNSANSIFLGWWSLQHIVTMIQLTRKKKVMKNYQKMIFRRRIRRRSPTWVEGFSFIFYKSTFNNVMMTSSIFMVTSSLRNKNGNLFFIRNQKLKSKISLISNL